MAWSNPATSYASGGLDRETGENIPGALWQRLMDNLTFLGDAAGLAPVRKIAEATPSGATIDFTSIPATYRHLWIVLFARGDAAFVSRSCYVRFNNDATGTYDYQLMNANGATLAGSGLFAQTEGNVGQVPAASATANVFGSGEILIPHYAQAVNNKTYRASTGMKYGTSAGNLWLDENRGFWRSNAAINRVTIFPSTGTFAAGTIATLYGLPA